MTKGLNRRDETNNPLEGAVAPTPQRRASIPMSSGNSSTNLDAVQQSSDMLNFVSRYGQKIARDRGDAKRRRQRMEGEVAFQQGKSFEEVETSGDKYALQGYRVMQSQTLAAKIFAEQQSEIKNSKYAQSPEEFRMGYGEFVEESVKGLDSQTASMVEERLSKQMPILVDMHTRAHLAYQEQESFKSLASSLGTLGQDDTADEELLLNATGEEGSPSSGLSHERRVEAVVTGVEFAFSQGNPKAYAKLKKSGALEDLSPDQILRVQKAEEAYFSEQASKVNVDFIQKETALFEQISSGELSPQEAVNAWVAVSEDYDRNVTHAQGKAVYLTAYQAQEYKNRGKSVLVEEATLRKDWRTVAKLTEPMMVMAESGGDPTAISPVGAMGTHQVMPDTVKDPGYGIKPADITDPKDVARVGSEYWAVMVSGKASGYNLPWEPGDVEAAAVAYNAGPKNAIKWVEAGRDYSVLPKREETEPYAKKILKAATGQGVIPSSEQEYKAAVAKKKATEAWLDMQNYEAYGYAQLETDLAYSNNQISTQEYLIQTGKNRETYDIKLTKARADHTRGMVKEVHTKATEKAQGEQKEILDAQYNVMLTEFNSKMAVENQPPEYYEELAKTFIEDASQMYAEQGIALADFGYSDIVQKSAEGLERSLREAEENRVSDKVVQKAVEDGTLHTLPKEQQYSAFDKINAHADNLVSAAVSSGELDPAESEAARSLAVEDAWLQVKHVDPREVEAASVALSSPLIAKDGTINAEAREVISRYARLKQSNPYVASKYLSPEAQGIAEAVLSASGGDNRPVEDGMVRYEQSRQSVGNQGKDIPTISPEAEKNIRKKVRGKFAGIVATENVGLLQAVFTDARLEAGQNMLSSSKESLLSEDTAGLYEDLITEEVLFQASLQPGANPEYLIPAATNTVKSRVDFVGEGIVVMNRGKGLKEQMFGPDLVEYDTPGLANIVVTSWLKELSKEEGYGFISDASVLQALNPFGSDVDTAKEAGEIKARGVRPYYVLSDGDRAAVVIQNQDGTTSEPIPLDLPKIGKWYKEQRKTKLTK